MMTTTTMMTTMTTTMRGRRVSMAKALLLCFLFACSLVTAASFSTSINGNRGSRTDKYSKWEGARSNSRRRQLLGPGSYPPRCNRKCGSCGPCCPVHVAVPPGAHMVAEYYPEAWRCKCGSRLYIP